MYQNKTIEDSLDNVYNFTLQQFSLILHSTYIQIIFMYSCRCHSILITCYFVFLNRHGLVQRFLISTLIVCLSKIMSQGCQVNLIGHLHIPCQTADDRSDIVSLRRVNQLTHAFLFELISLSHSRIEYNNMRCSF